MRLRFAMELVLALGVGLGLARYRLTWPDREETFGPMTQIDALEVGIDSLLAGIGLVEGLATVVERFRGKSPVPWGPGRRAWVVVAGYLLLNVLDHVLGSIAAKFAPGLFIRDSPVDLVLQGIRGRYGLFLLPAMSWFLLALGLAALAERAPRGAPPDAREWSGRAFAAVLVLAGLAFRAAELFGLRLLVMGGGAG